MNRWFFSQFHFSPFIFLCFVGLKLRNILPSTFGRCLHSILVSFLPDSTHMNWGTFGKAARGNARRSSDVLKLEAMIASCNFWRCLRPLVKLGRFLQKRVVVGWVYSRNVFAFGVSIASLFHIRKHWNMEHGGVMGGIWGGTGGVRSIWRRCGCPRCLRKYLS